MSAAQHYSRPAHGVWKFLYKVGNFLERVPGLKQVVRSPTVLRVRNRVLVNFVNGLEDRRYWNKTEMPALLGAGFRRILFVGCEPYTAWVPRAFEERGVECWTTDILPANAGWGNPDRHIVADIAAIEAHPLPEHFDAVLFNGVMGYGVTGEMMTVIAPVLARLLPPNGFLLIGWNQGLVEDPLTLSAVTHLFNHQPWQGLPARKTFERSTHVFDHFIKRNGS